MENKSIQSIINSDITISEINMMFTERKEVPWKHDRPRMAYHYLSLTIEGTAFIKSGNETYVLKPGEMIYIPKGADYHSRSRELPFSFIMVEFDFVEDKFLNFNFKPVFRFDNPEKIKEIMFDLYNAWQDKSAGNKLKLKMIMYRLLNAMVKQSSELQDSYSYKKIKKAISYMEKNYTLEYTDVSKLAEMCEISTVQFNRIFKNLYNTTPAKYMNTLRINDAKTMLKSTNTPISLIAEKCGFSSNYYFSRLFKASVGLSPLKYREKFYE